MPKKALSTSVPQPESKQVNIDIDHIKYQVKNLVNELLKFENITRVRATYSNPEDKHWIDFEIEIDSENVSYELWGKMQHLVIQCEWKLRDETEEKWYFNLENKEYLTPLAKDIEMIADSKLTSTPKKL